MTFAVDDGSEVTSTVDGGREMTSAGDNGREVTFAGDNRREITSADDDGREVTSADDDGRQVTSADDNGNGLVFKEVVDLNERTADVLSDTTFQSMMINPTIIKSLTRHGFIRPSPVQAKALPLGLFGMDMLVQAKTGTGKTLVFAILCADQLINAAQRERLPQVIIVSPTREIAMQTYEVVRKICPKNFFHGLFIGGVDISHDKNILRKGCQVAVGTSGRLAHLVKMRILDLEKITLFVLDEADKLMEDSFQNEINFLFSSLTPDLAQVCVFSATYPRDLDQVLCNYMKEPSLIRLNVKDSQLIGVKQYVVFEEGRLDVEILLILLNSIIFSQCLVFSNDQKRCTEICDFLKERNILASHFSSSLNQEERFKVIKDFKNFRIRILISSDLSSRGIDAEHVDLVINVESPRSVEGYLHRIGRAGRFGKHGAALTILSDDRELYRFKLLVRRENLNIKLLYLNSNYANDLTTNVHYFEHCAKPFVCKFEDDIVTNLRNLKIQENNSREIIENNSSNISLSAENQKQSDVIEPKIVPLSLRSKTEILGSGAYSRTLTSTRVPLRRANRTKYYLRKELLAIRDLATDAEWSAYGRSYLKFNESETIKYLSKIAYTKQVINSKLKKLNETLELQMTSNDSSQAISSGDNNVNASALERIESNSDGTVSPKNDNLEFENFFLTADEFDPAKYMVERAKNDVCHPQCYDRISNYGIHIEKMKEMLQSEYKIVMSYMNSKWFSN